VVIRSQATMKGAANLPNFEVKIFKDITGIDVAVNSQKQELLNKANELIQKAEELKVEAEKLS